MHIQAYLWNGSDIVNSAYMLSPVRLTLINQTKLTLKCGILCSRFNRLPSSGKVQYFRTLLQRLKSSPSKVFRLSS